MKRKRNLCVANVLEALCANPVADPHPVEDTVLLALHGGLVEMDPIGRDRLDVFHVHVAKAVARGRDFLTFPLQPSIESKLFAHGMIQCIMEHGAQPGIRRVNVVPVHGCNGLSAVLGNDDPGTPSKGEHASILVSSKGYDGDSEEQQHAQHQVPCHFPAMHAPNAVLELILFCNNSFHGCLVGHFDAQKPATDTRKRIMCACTQTS
jgi:hypothetical protein